MKTSLLNTLKTPLLLVLLICTLYACKKNKTEDNQPQSPEITSIQPKNPKPGTVVTITGKNFGSTKTDVKVKIGDSEISIASVTDTEIKFSIPENITSGDLQLLIKNIIATSKDPEGVAITIPTVTTTPTFTAMTPNKGKTGDEVTLTGTNFSTRISDNKVFFPAKSVGTVVLATIKSATSTKLVVQVPENVKTGGLLIDVNGTNAIPATGFNTTFTIEEGPGGTGSNTVDYIDVKSGALKFSKVVKASSDIGAMHLDKVKNWIYYSDYTVMKYNNTSRLYKVDPAGTAPTTLLTTDERINMVTNITSDAEGNVYVLKYETGLNFSIYKITPDGTKVTEIAKNFELFAGRTHFFVDANHQIHLRPFLKFKADGTKITEGPDNINGLQKDNGAFYAGNFAYFSQETDNGQNANKCRFIKYDLSKDTFEPTDFSLKSLYGTDDPELFSKSNNIPWLKYALDADENFYAIMEGSYVPGSIGKTWILRKTKNGSGKSTLLGSFTIKFPAIDLNEYSSSIEFVSDSRGNLFFKANSTDIIKITQ